MSQMKNDARAAVKTWFAAEPGREEKFPAAPGSAKKLGYDPQEIDALPPPVTGSFCGADDPLGLGEAVPRLTALDLGCGAGLDSLLAARRVGPIGRVVGVDLRPQVVAKARNNTDTLGQGGAERREATEQAKKNAAAIGAGHSFIVSLGDGFFPLNVLNTLKMAPEVCRIFCATANPTEVVVAETEQGRGIPCVVDGFSPKGVEGDADIRWRKDLLRKTGYKQ